ncbi:MAG TPA: LLM class flavin-dependent oxidoreductase [Solirubrobacteraceae bacterium]|nr:LLM class flavin-dependent oxidoreductase [Solirubrobacteraceae bacterium]
MPIEFGIFDHVEFYGDGQIKDLYERRIASIKRIEAAGFYAYHLAEHHGAPLSVTPSAPVFLSAVARETTTIKLIPTVVCLPLHHPVRIFEELAMLDVISGGRLEFGVGKGITSYEHLQFGHPPEEGPARLADGLKILLRAFETGIVSSEGSEFHDFAEMKLPFEPIQRPYPPLWTAGNVEMAGRGGHNLISPAPMTAEIRARYDELRTASRQEPGHQNPHITEPKLGHNQALVVARTDDEAEAIARRAWGRYIATMRRARSLVPPHLQGEELPEFETDHARKMLGGDPFETGSLIAGSVERIRDVLVERARTGLVNYFLFMIPFGDMTDNELGFIVDAMQAEIIPAVREAAAVGSPA